jgi:hypothetical protein
MQYLISIAFLIILSGCGTNLRLTPHVPDFQLKEVRKYTPISEKNQYTKFDKLLPLDAVDSMYCFPKEEVSALVQEWKRRRQAPK